MPHVPTLLGISQSPTPPQHAWCRDVVGFRAPYFTFSEVLGTVLQDLGFLWDSSLTGKNWTQPGHILSAPIPWPYSYCSGSFCGNWSSLSIW